MYHILYYRTEPQSVLRRQKEWINESCCFFHCLLRCSSLFSSKLFQPWIWYELWVLPGWHRACFWRLCLPWIAIIPRGLGIYSCLIMRSSSPYSGQLNRDSLWRHRWRQGPAGLRKMHFPQGSVVPSTCPCICVRLIAQSCPAVCNSMHCSLRGSSANGISQARMLQCVAISSSRRSTPPPSLPRDGAPSPAAPALACRYFITGPPGKPFHTYVIF